MPHGFGSTSAAFGAMRIDDAAEAPIGNLTGHSAV